METIEITETILVLIVGKFTLKAFLLTKSNTQ